jgi:hypothetical protein
METQNTALSEKSADIFKNHEALAKQAVNSPDYRTKT